MRTVSHSSLLPCWRRFTVLAALLGAAFLLPPAPLEWSRNAIAGGEYWRLVTGHWVHMEPYHLLLNLGGLLITGMLFTRHPPLLLWAGFLIVSPVVVSGGLLVFVPELAWYRGFSGCLHGLVVFTAMHNLVKEKSWSLMILGVVAAKLALETVVSPITGENSLIGGVVIPQSHWLGAVTGLAAGIAVGISNRLPRNVRE